MGSRALGCNFLISRAGPLDKLLVAVVVWAVGGIVSFEVEAIVFGRFVRGDDDAEGGLWGGVAGI